MPAAIVYLRVSTKKQEQRNELNLPAQQKRCEDWCRSQGLPVLAVFTGHGESAWKTDRPTLDEAIDFIKKSKGAVTHFVVQDSTRFSRNSEVKAFACVMLRNLNVTLVSVDEPMLNDSPEGRLTGTLLTGMAEFYSHSLSSRVRYRFQVHREQGRYLHAAPLAYRNVQQNGSKTLELDESAPLLRQCFEMIASGEHTSDNVRKLITAAGLRTKKGRKLTKQSFSYTLKNPVYCGQILHKGKTYKGSFPALVSEELWQQTQDALHGRKKSMPKKPTNEIYPLRGFVKCGYCDSKLTSGNVRGRSKNYVKYWCWNKECKHPVNVSKEKLEADWIDFLERMQPAFDALTKVIPLLAKAKVQTRLVDTEHRQRQLSTQLADKNALNVKLITAKLNGEIGQEDFDTMKAVLAKDIAEIEAAQRAVESEAATFAQLTADTTRQTVPAGALWASAAFNERQTVQSVLYPEGICYRTDIGFFTPVSNELEAMVFKGLIELAEHEETEEVLSGRDDWI